MCPEQFEAAKVEPRQEDDGVPRLQPEEGRRREESIEVGFTRGEGFLDAFGPFLLEVVHLGEPFAAQQCFGHILGGLTDARDLDQPDRGRFGRWFRSHPPGVQAKQPCAARERHPPQESLPAERSSMVDTHGNLPSTDASQCNPKNVGQWTLLSSHEQAQHLTLVLRRRGKRASAVLGRPPRLC